jgi:hypothetical protein
MATSEPIFGTVALTAAGLGTVVAGGAGTIIKVLAYNLSGAGTTSLRFMTGTVVPLTGTMLAAANGYYPSGYSPVGHFETASGDNLVGSLSATQAVSGHITYVLKT